MQNMVGKPSHAIALGAFVGRKVWIEDDEGTSVEQLTRKSQVHKLKGS